jgi:hypothetical protein
MIETYANMLVFVMLNASQSTKSVYLPEVPTMKKLLIDESLVLLVRLVPVAVFLLRY